MTKGKGEIIQFPTDKRIVIQQHRQLKKQKNQELDDVLNFIGGLKTDMIKELQNPSIEESMLFEFQQSMQHQIALLDIVSDYIRQKENSM